MTSRYKLSPRAKRLDDWLRPIPELVREQQVLTHHMHALSATADEYDGDVRELLAADQRQAAQCRRRLAWYRLRVLHMIEDADWEHDAGITAKKARDTAINRFYRGLPLIGSGTLITCANLAGVSARRIMQLRVEALNRMAPVWHEETCPY